MYTLKRLLVVLAMCCFMNTLLAQENPELGTTISEEDLAPWDISIQPNGSGLPPGSGSVSDGEVIYQQKCIACHGVEGTEGPYDVLVSNQLQQVRAIGSYWPYASTVFDYIRRAMPFNLPQSLTDDEVYAVTAYLLYRNGIISEDSIMTANSLANVEMPNESGFDLAYPTEKSMEEMSE